MGKGTNDAEVGPRDSLGTIAEKGYLMMTNVLQVTVAINSEEGARRIAETLIAKRLAASVWISSPITSTYWWKGRVEQAQEWVCTAKTRDDLYPDLERTIKSLHPYEVPGIIATPIVMGSQSYLDWLEQETSQEKDISSHQSGQYEEQDHRLSIAKERLLQELIDAHERLISAATAAHGRGVTQEDDRWGPREVMAHIAGWEANAIARIPRMIANETALKYDHDAFNATVITIAGNQSFDAIRDILRQTYQRDVQMLREQENSIFVPGNPLYERIQAAIYHTNDHAQRLDAL